MNSTSSPTTWPPPYTIKVSSRARQVRLKASALRGLELVVPKRFDTQRVPQLLETHRAWIEKNLTTFASLCHIQHDQPLPETLSLECIKQIWKIQYIHLEQKKNIQLYIRPNYELVLAGNISNKVSVIKSLKFWLKQQSQHPLKILLEKISKEIDLPYSRVIIRAQQTRWGSCSAKKSISLNYKLLFLPTHLTRHVVIHELCHTKHLNHSEKFWRLVETFDPDWKLHHQLLRKAAHWIPAWA